MISPWNKTLLEVVTPASSASLALCVGLYTVCRGTAALQDRELVWQGHCCSWPRCLSTGCSPLVAATRYYGPCSVDDACSLIVGPTNLNHADYECQSRVEVTGLHARLKLRHHQPDSTTCLLHTLSSSAAQPTSSSTHRVAQAHTTRQVHLSSCSGQIQQSMRPSQAGHVRPGL